jgi:hypothetical protein
MVGDYNKQHGQIKDLMHPQSQSRFSKGIQESDSVCFFEAENWNIGPFPKKAKAMLEPLFFNISESQLSGHVVDLFLLDPFGAFNIDERDGLPPFRSNISAIGK